MENFPSSCLRLCLTFQTLRAYGVCLGGNHVLPAPLPRSRCLHAPRIWGTEARKGGKEGRVPRKWRVLETVAPSEAPDDTSAWCPESWGWEGWAWGAAHGTSVFRALCSQRSPARALHRGAVSQRKAWHHPALSDSSPKQPWNCTRLHSVFVRDHLLMDRH